MSTPSITVYRDLIASFPTWTALKAHLTGDGLRLRVDDNSLPDSPFALIRYVKGQSDMSNPVVRAFRSVVWDTLAHRPVSVTSWKSADGESVPETPLRDLSGAPQYNVEPFHDGTLIGLFWDQYSGRWRIHTRSILDARCRYYSDKQTFADMFWGWCEKVGLDLSTFDKTQSYSFVLQHPENRIVCHVGAPRAIQVDRCVIATDGWVAWPMGHNPTFAAIVPSDWAEVRTRLADLNDRFKHNYQGYVIKGTDGRRWKLRTPEYNRVRNLRGNSPRRDFLWLSAWRNGTLRDYLALFPEERGAADAMIAQWKTVTNDVYRLYGEAFKARTLDRKMIPPKYRPLVYGLHSLFMETLKPVGKTVDWRTCLEYMNSRDAAQMLFVIHWDYRAAQRVSGAMSIPIEPPAFVGTAVEAAGDVTAKVDE